MSLVASELSWLHYSVSFRRPGKLISYQAFFFLRCAEYPSSDIIPQCSQKYFSPPTRSVKSGRSEEHTSELQSLMRISSAVLCLKKQIQNHAQKQTHTPQGEYSACTLAIKQISESTTHQ